MTSSQQSAAARWSIQNYAVYPHMTVAQEHGYALKGGTHTAGGERDERVRRIAGTPAGAASARKPSELRAGRERKKKTACCHGPRMVRSPGISLRRAPANLDARLRIQMRLETKRCIGTAQKKNDQRFFVTHDQVEAMTLADTLVVMNEGLIEQVGSPSEVYRRPKSRFVANFLGSPPMNFPPGHHRWRRPGRPCRTVGMPWPHLRWDLPQGAPIEIAPAERSPSLGTGPGRTASCLSSWR